MNNKLVFDDSYIPFTQKYIAMFLISRKMCPSVQELGRVQQLVHSPYQNRGEMIIFFYKFAAESNLYL